VPAGPAASAEPAAPAAASPSAAATSPAGTSASSWADAAGVPGGRGTARAELLPQGRDLRLQRTDDSLGVEDDGEDQQDPADGVVVLAQPDPAVVEDGGQHGRKRDHRQRRPDEPGPGQLEQADQQQADEDDVDPQRHAVVDQRVGDAAGRDDAGVDAAADRGHPGQVGGREECEAAHGRVGAHVGGGLLVGEHGPAQPGQETADGERGQLDPGNRDPRGGGRPLVGPHRQHRRPQPASPQQRDPARGQQQHDQAEHAERQVRVAVTGADAQVEAEDRRVLDRGAPETAVELRVVEPQVLQRGGQREGYHRDRQAPDAQRRQTDHDADDHREHRGQQRRERERHVQLELDAGEGEGADAGNGQLREGDLAAVAGDHHLGQRDHRQHQRGDDRSPHRVVGEGQRDESRHRDDHGRHQVSARPRRESQRLLDDRAAGRQFLPAQHQEDQDDDKGDQVGQP
jgi:hypothetical protein